MPHKRFRQTCHVLSVIDAEIAGKGQLWPEISLDKTIINNCKCVINFTILGKRFT